MVAGGQGAGKRGTAKGEARGDLGADCVVITQDTMHLPKLSQLCMKRLSIVVPSWKALVF